MGNKVEWEKNMNTGDIVTFDTKKNLTFIRTLGSGGTGDTHLFRDETTDMLFAVKKYVPKDARFIDEHYSRFVDEIKILLNISHPNIVRIYNYYLYPEAKTGYLQMEYIDGVCIDQYHPMPWEKGWDDVFGEVIRAFAYLEEHNILHRDVRPANILIDNNGNVKIIDFGFGKQLREVPSDIENSILLNWPATDMPEEVIKNNDYDERTEVFFVGTLFRHLLGADIDRFRFNHIIEKMIKVDPEQRYGSFATIITDIAAGVLSLIDFTTVQKRIYRVFVDTLCGHIYSFKSRYSPKLDVEQMITDLAVVIRQAALEEYLQNNSSLIRCFVTCGYTYNPSRDIPVQVIVDFYGLITGLDYPKRKVLMDNLSNRFATIRVEEEDDDLPF